MTQGPWKTPASIIAADRVMPSPLKRGQQAAMVRRTRSVIQNYLQYGGSLSVYDTNYVSWLFSCRTEQEILQIDGVGPATIRLLKAWLAIHQREFSHG